MSHDLRENDAAFRFAMRHAASSVAIVTACSAGKVYGMTATAMTSVSMDPPSLLIAVNREASVHNPIHSTRRFCVNLLGARHESCCKIFSNRAEREKRFEVGDWGHDEHGIPYLRDAQAALFCELDKMVDYGTHTIFIGRVVNPIVAPTIDPLVYLDGSLLNVSVMTPA